jgi:NADP-dependent aldehyde dehydrogenase
MLVPLGTSVGVFGASNFPFAYGVCGGDTASALAAGLCVVVKEHPAQPRVGRMLAKIAADSGAPVAYVLHEDAKNLRVARELIEAVDAVGFTGSAQGGQSVADLAHALRKPAFCEMGSANLVDIGSEAIATAAQREALACLLGGSIVARVGQQCTRPGILSVSHDDPEAFADFARALAAVLDAAPPRRMLSEHVASRYAARVRQMVRDGCGVLTKRAKPLEAEKRAKGSKEPARMLAVPMLLRYGGAFDLEDVGAGLAPRTLLDEVFGPAAMIVPSGEAIATNQLFANPRLTTTLHGVAPASNSTRRAGRVVFGGVPTGVRVCHSMVHSGPFPASNAPHTTAVGPLAVERWCTLACWQSAPASELPEELRDENPRGIMRMVDGEWTRR